MTLDEMDCYYSKRKKTNIEEDKEKRTKTFVHILIIDVINNERNLKDSDFLL